MLFTDILRLCQFGQNCNKKKVTQQINFYIYFLLSTLVQIVQKKKKLQNKFLQIFCISLSTVVQIAK